MARSKTSNTAVVKQTRVRKPQYYKVAFKDQDIESVLVIAANQKHALAAVLTLSVATPADLVKAGKDGYRVIDATVPPEQMSIPDAA